MPEQFQPGDVVKLKSGGQKMTVMGMGRTGSPQVDAVGVVWMTADGTTKTDFIPPAALVKIGETDEDEDGRGPF